MPKVAAAFPVNQVETARASAPFFKGRHALIVMTGVRGTRGFPGHTGANGHPGSPGAPGRNGLPGPAGHSVDPSQLQEFYGQLNGVVRRASDASYVGGATVRLMADKKVAALSSSNAIHPFSAYRLFRFCAQSSPSRTGALNCQHLAAVTWSPSPATG